MSSSIALPRVRTRTAATALALLGILLAGLLLGGTAASARPTHPRHPSHGRHVASHGAWEHSNGKHSSGRHSTAQRSSGYMVLADPVGPIAPNGNGEGGGGGLLGRVIGGLVGAVNTVGAAVPVVVDDAVRAVNNTAGSLTGRRTTAPAPAPGPSQGPAPAPPPGAAPQPGATTPAPARAHSAHRVAARPVPAAGRNGSGSAPTTAPSATKTPAPPHSALDDLLRNPAALLSAPGTAVLIGMILVFLGGVVAVVFGAGYRGRRAH